MSKTLSLKLRDEVFQEAERIRRKQQRPRNAYFNEAISFYNRVWGRQLLAEALAKESRALAAESMVVLSEFEAFQDEIPA